MKNSFITFCCCVAITACSSEPFIQDKNLDASNSATLFVYTPDTEFNRQNFIKPTIYVDNTELGKVSIKEPLIAQLPAGKHDIAFKRAFPLEAATLEIDMQKSGIYYIRYSLDFDDLAQPDQKPDTMGASSFRLVVKSKGENRE